MSKKSSAKSAKVAATKNPATEKARKQAIAAIGARIEALDGAAPRGDGAPTALVAPVAGGAPAPADAAQTDAATPAKSKKTGKKAAAAKPAKAPKAAKPAKEPKAKKTPKAPKVKKVSALDAAAQVLARAKEPMRSQQLIDEMAAKGLWTSPGGQTPSATLYAAMLREITAKGKESRFKKSDRGLFTAGPGLAR
jgi:hypothetical protein